MFLRSVYGNAWKVTSSVALPKFQKIFPLPPLGYDGSIAFDRIPSLKPLVRQRHGTYEVSLKSRIKIPLGFKHSVFGSVAFKIFDFTLDAANRACFGASGCHYFWADMLPDRYGRITSITPLLTLSIIAEKHYETNTLQMLHIPKRCSLRNCKFQCPIRGTKGSYVFRCPSRSTQNRRCRTKGFQKSR